jgi:hypothetical protein
MTGVIGYLRSRAVDPIIRYYRETAHPHVELLPNARIGLHAIARTCLAPGDRVLISPLTCHTVMEAFFQAGVAPVFANINPKDGNIDISAIGQRTLRSIKAIVTTNLYGNPDCALELADTAKRHNILLIEDCAHVFETAVGGRRIGSIGDLSVFSFKKFFDVPGGVLAGGDAIRVEKIGEWLRKSCRFPAGARELSGWARKTAGNGLRNLSDLRLRLGDVVSMRPGICAISDPKVRSGVLEVAPRVAMADFLVFPLVEELNRVAAILAHPERFREDWEGGNQELILRVPLEYRRSPYPSTVVHMTVPFFCANRDDLLGYLRGRGIPIWYLYNPPMNYLYASVVPANPLLDLDRLEDWRRRILPLPGRHAGRILSEMAQQGTEPNPAAAGSFPGGS